MKKLNTKNCCFLCLQSSKIKIEDHDENSESAFHPIRKNQSLLRCLIRHLQINLIGVGADSSNSNIESRTNSDVEVSLCEDCAQLNSTFSKLFLQLEKIQMEMNFYLGRIHHRLLESLKNAKLIQNYSKEMTSDRETLTQLAFVDKLRKEIAEKSSILASVNPRVYLTSTELTKVITVKREAEEIGDFDEINHFEDHNSDGCSPTFEDSPEQLDIGLSLELKPEVTCEIQKVKRVHSKVNKCYSRNLSTGKYHCIICGKSFKRSNKVRVHYEAVHLKKTFKCDSCSMSYARIDYLRKHKRTCKGEAFVKKKINVYYTKNKVTGLLQCTKCEKEYRFRTPVVDHYETVHLQKRYKCDICNVKEFAHPNSLKYHKKKCNTDRFEDHNSDRHIPTREQSDTPETKPEVTSEVQGKSSVPSKLVKFYSRNSTTGRYHCTICRKPFQTSGNVRIHYEAIHLKKTFKCNNGCNTSFPRVDSLRRHQKICKGVPTTIFKNRLTKYFTRNPTTGEYICTRCSKPFKQSSNVQQHYEAVHLGIKKFKCDVCNVAFAQKGALKKHKTFCSREGYPVRVARKNVYYTEDRISGMFQCTKCEKTSLARNTIMDHYETIHLLRRYKCDICNVEEFTRRSAVNRHKKKCKITFGDGRKINSEQFLCKFCGKRFPTNGRLKHHRKEVHLGKYACDLCDKKFNYACSMRTHKAKAHFGKRFECRFCRKNFRAPYFKRRHERDCQQKIKIEHRD